MGLTPSPILPQIDVITPFNTSKELHVHEMLNQGEDDCIDFWSIKLAEPSRTSLQHAYTSPSLHFLPHQA